MFFMAQAPTAQPVNANLTTSQIFPLRVDAGGGSYSSSASIPAQLSVPGGGRLEGRPFCVYASGYAISTTGTPTVTLTLFAGPVNSSLPNASLTPGTNTTITTSAASSSIGVATVPWSAFYMFEGDSVSGKVQGWAEVQINGVYQIRAAFSAGSGIPLTGVTFGPASKSQYPPLGLTTGQDPVFNLVLGITFSTNQASVNSAVLDNFILES